MANINVVVDRPIADGYKLKFRTPCDSTTIEGLEVKYPAKNGVGTLIKKFTFKDAHGAELSGVGNLFVSGVMIEVLLDVTHSVAYIKNADTNSYVESVKGEVARLEESQKQFLSVAGKIVEECERATNEMGLSYEEIVRGGHVENLKELNNGGVFSVWVGDMEQYDALEEKESNRLYVITHDIPGDGFDSTLAAHTAAIEENTAAIEVHGSAIAENKIATEDNATAIQANTAAIEENATAILGVQNALLGNAKSGRFEFTDEPGNDGLTTVRIPIGGSDKGMLLVGVSYEFAQNGRRDYSLNVLQYDLTHKDADGRYYFDNQKITGTMDLLCNITEDGSALILACEYSESFGWWIGIA